MTTLPNGQQFTSSALSSDDLCKLLQDVTAGAFGYDVTDPAQTSAAYTAVRVGWPPQGQPGFTQQDAVVFVRVTERDDESVTRIYEEEVEAAGDGAVIRQGNTRVWDCKWVFYGPLCDQRARQLRSVMRGDWAGDTLALSNLYPVVDIPTPTRAPELFQGGWWDRTDLDVRINEGITETLTVTTGRSVEVSIAPGVQPAIDITIASGDE